MYWITKNTVQHSPVLPVLFAYGPIKYAEISRIGKIAEYSLPYRCHDFLNLTSGQMIVGVDLKQ